MRSFIAALAITSSLLVAPGWADETPFLLERKIPLGEVRGRIDHLASSQEGQKPSPRRG
jgi:hypothetical protein